MPMKSPRTMGLSCVSYVNPLFALPSRFGCRFAERLSRRLARATLAKAAESARLASPGAYAGTCTGGTRTELLAVAEGACWPRI